MQNYSEIFYGSLNEVQKKWAHLSGCTHYAYKRVGLVVDKRHVVDV